MCYLNLIFFFTLIMNIEVVCAFILFCEDNTWFTLVKLLYVNHTCFLNVILWITFNQKCIKPLVSAAEFTLETNF